MLYCERQELKNRQFCRDQEEVNLDQTTLILWLLAAVVVLAVVLYVVIKRKREQARNAAQGRRGEAAVARKLGSICRSKGFALLNNVYLPLYDTTTQIDHMSPDQLKLYSQMSNKSLNAAKVFIAMVPMMCVYPFLQRYFVTGVLLGAVKG